MEEGERERGGGRRKGETRICKSEEDINVMAYNEFICRWNSSMLNLKKLKKPFDPASASSLVKTARDLGNVYRMSNLEISITLEHKRARKDLKAERK